MSATTAWSIVWGLVLGLGLWSVVSALPNMNRPRLATRVAPYLVDVSEEARRVADRTARVTGLGRSHGASSRAAGTLAAVRRGLSRMLGASDALAVRLRQAGSTLTVDEFRLRQAAWTVGGAAAGALIVGFAATARVVPPAVVVLTPVVLGVAGYLLRDHLLSRAVSQRTARMAEEFPTVLELLTLSLSAGEGIHDALRRVARTSSGELARELAGVVAETGMGVPLPTALRAAATGIRLPQFGRWVDAVVGSLERGTPVVEVLRAQSADAREAGKRELLEQAGKKEIGMLVPLVFLILPVTVLFAIWPGLVVLQSGF